MYWKKWYTSIFTCVYSKRKHTKILYFYPSNFLSTPYTIWCNTPLEYLLIHIFLSPPMTFCHPSLQNYIKLVLIYLSHLFSGMFLKSQDTDLPMNNVNDISWCSALYHKMRNYITRNVCLLLLLLCVQGWKRRDL